ncbi:hypothetical protein D3C83_181000 [compost metagenome]
MAASLPRIVSLPSPASAFSIMVPAAIVTLCPSIRLASPGRRSSVVAVAMAEVLMPSMPAASDSRSREGSVPVSELNSSVYT